MKSEAGGEEKSRVAGEEKEEIWRAAESEGEARGVRLDTTRANEAARVA